MSSANGELIRFGIFGESHGTAIGGSLDGLPAGVPVDLDLVKRDLDRRRPGQGKLSTARNESDSLEILAGIKDGKTSGGPVAFMIRNSDQHSSDYDPALMRPSHADLPEWWREKGRGDMRGGGRFSGRLTAPLVAAGGIARGILARRGVFAGSHIVALAGIRDIAFGLGAVDPTPEVLATLNGMHLPCLDDQAERSMRHAIETAKAELDSVGGTIETAVIGLPPGIGEPPYGGVEPALASWLYAIPAIKGLEFGAGAAFADMRGSAANDPIGIDRDGKPRPLANRSGGANGGMTNGRALIFRSTLRPTPSIASPQKSVRLAGSEDGEAVFESIDLVVKGRHDPCVVPRAVPGIEAASLLCLLDLACRAEGREWMTC